MRARDAQDGKDGEMAHGVIAIVLVDVRHLLHVAQLICRPCRDDLEWKADGYVI